VEPAWPKDIASHWTGLAWDRDIDAAVNWGDGKVYFFKDDQYVRYDVASDRAEPGWPKRIRDHWPGLWQRDIDAAVNWWNGKAYFFKGAEYVRYDIAADAVDAGYPKEIARHWRGLWDRDLDAVVNWGDGKAYFFKGAEYIRYDLAADVTDFGPAPIPASFDNLSRGGASRAMAWGGRVSPGFRTRVLEICASLEIEPSYLMAAMAFETGRTFSPSIRNPISGATGLIQFMPATAARLGTTTNELAAMSPETQLDFVERYLRPFEGRLRTLADVYMTILFPAAVSRPGNFALFSRPEVAYEQNSGLDRNRDGRVTKSEAEVPVRALLAEGLTVAL
jgi:hemopexin